MPAPEAAVPLAEKAPPAGAVVSDCAVKLAAAPVTPALFVAVTDAAAGRRGAGEGVGAGGVRPAAAGDRAVVVRGDAGVGVGRAARGGGEAAAGAALEVDDRAGAGPVRGAAERAEGEARRRGRAGRVDLDGGGDRAAAVADVVGAAEREQVAVAAGDGLAGRAGDRRRARRSCRSCPPMSVGRLDGQRRVGEAGRGGGLRLGEVGAAVDRQRRAAVEVARRAGAATRRCRWR